MASPSPRSFYAGVFVVSGLLMALQVIQSRIFSVTTWYHLSFLVISIAMFGLTLGALKVHRGKEAEQRTHFGREMAASSMCFGVAILVALATQMFIPIISDNLVHSLIILPVVSLLSLSPYYYAGIVLSLAMTRAPFPAARTYGADLLGAAAGCLFALAAVETVDAPSAMLVLSLLALAAARCFGAVGGRRIWIVAAMAAIALATNLCGAKPVIYPLWVKNNTFDESTLAYDHWNSISRVMINAEKQDIYPYLWGPSPRLPKELKNSWYELLIDGEASTPINHWSGDTGKELHFLDYDVTTIAYSIPGMKSAGIIGLGGGRDVLTALHAGITKVTAMDVNNVQVSVLSRIEPFKSYAHIVDRPGVKLIHSEARSWFNSHPDTFDLIQMSLVDTSAATGAGAFTLTENGLYTVEGWKTFLDHLNPGGVMTVSRWYFKDAQNEGERLVSLTMGALFAKGVTDPEKHIFLATSQSVVTMVLARDAFTEKQLNALEKRVKEMDFNILTSPHKPATGSEFASILRTRSQGELEQLASTSTFDIIPSTDQRPFFFNQVRVGNPIQVLRLVSQNGRSAILGHAHAIMNLYVIILFSLLMVVFAILYPLRAELKAGRAPFIVAGSAWFVLIGLGFMLLEISLLQRMSVYLGHPAYGLSVVLFSLVLSTGCGSLLSDVFPLKTGRARLFWALGTACAIGASVFGIDGMMKSFPDISLTGRAALCVTLILPLGCLLGFGFPTGMAMAHKENPRATAWFWGINGAAGVMGSSLAIASNIAGGINRTMLVAALCYALLAIPGYLRKAGR